MSIDDHYFPAKHQTKPEQQITNQTPVHQGPQPIPYQTTNPPSIIAKETVQALVRDEAGKMTTATSKDGGNGIPDSTLARSALASVTVSEPCLVFSFVRLPSALFSFCFFFGDSCKWFFSYS